jgi:hypothetical protein
VYLDYLCNHWSVKTQIYFRFGKSDLNVGKLMDIRNSMTASKWKHSHLYQDILRYYASSCWQSITTVNRFHIEQNWTIHRCVKVTCGMSSSSPDGFLCRSTYRVNRKQYKQFKYILTCQELLTLHSFFSLFIDFNTCITVRKLQEGTSAQYKYTHQKLSNWWLSVSV